MINCSVLTEKITANKSENVLVENELKKLKTFDSSYFIGKSHFEEDGTQNCLVFRQLNKYFNVSELVLILFITIGLWLKMFR